MSEKISYHRLGAFTYGFLCGAGLIMIISGLAFIAMLPSKNSMMNIGLILFGVILFAGGSCREAYLRGNLSVLTEEHAHAERNRPKTTSLTSEQIIEDPEETEFQKPYTS